MTNNGPAEIDPQTRPTGPRSPHNAPNFTRIGVLNAWSTYDDRLTWGRGQCLAILDDGCDLTDPPWRVQLPWGPKVIASYNSIDDNDDPTPVPPGYHGTSVGYPSSINHDGVCGIAYNNHVAQVRCVSIVHLKQDESATMAKALQWVIDHHEKLNITAVNLSPVDDQRHDQPLATAIDPPLARLRELGVWVSGPCGNRNYTDGISWPACARDCFAIGGTAPADSGENWRVYLNRCGLTDLVVAAAATSSSNAYAAASAMILREAIDQTGYPWQKDGPKLPEAMMAIFQQTGRVMPDPGTGLTFRELNLAAALAHVFNSP